MDKELGVSLVEAAAVIVTTLGIALALLVLLRLLGQRSIARMSTFDVTVLLLLGSAGGRVLTGYTPSLAAGVIALVTLVALSWGAGKLGRTRLGAALLHDRPILLMAGGDVLHDSIRRARISEAQLWEALRTDGIRNLSEVAAVVLEGTGSISVIRQGAEIDPKLLAGIAGAEGSAR